MSEEIIGVDKPAGSSRPPWWVYVVGVVVVAGLGAALFDAVTKTDSERAADAVVSFFDAYAQGDGDRACTLLTEDSQAEEVKLVALAKPSVSTCPEAIAADRAQTIALGGASAGASDVKTSDVESALEIDGDEATLDADSELTKFTLKLDKVDGEWLIDLSGVGTAPSSFPSSDASEADLIDAADQICLTAFQRSSSAIADLVAALNAHDRAGVMSAARAWADSEQQLVDDLQTLVAAQGSVPVSSLASALNREIEAIRRAGDGSQRALPALRDVRRESANVTTVAGEQGFAQLGCAAPSARG